MGHDLLRQPIRAFFNDLWSEPHSGNKETSLGIGLHMEPYLGGKKPHQALPYTSDIFWWEKNLTRHCHTHQTFFGGKKTSQGIAIHTKLKWWTQHFNNRAAEITS